MSKASGFKMTGFSSFAVAMLVAIGFSQTAFAALTVDHDGRYVYYRTAWTQLNVGDQKQIIDQSLVLMKNELSQRISKVAGLKTLSNFILSQKAMDELTVEAQQSVAIADANHWRNLLPSGFMLYGGGSADLGFFVSGKVSGDLGIVIVPTEVTRVDTLNQYPNVTYFELAYEWVVVPHLYAGVGVGGGVSNSVGVSLIWGKLNRPQDFRGVVVSGSAQAMTLLGVDFQGSLVNNMSLGQTFFVATGEFDWGAEASAGLDGEAGYVQPLSSVLNLLGANGNIAQGVKDVVKK